MEKTATLGKVESWGRRRALRHSALVSGGLICALASLAASLLAAPHPWKVWVPLAFSIVLLLIAIGFGAQAGILGTVIAAIVFAEFLYSPQRSLHVASITARSNLGWMLLIGIAFSLLFAPPSSRLGPR